MKNIPATTMVNANVSVVILRGVVKNIITAIYIRSLKARSGRLVSPESEVRKFLIRIYRLSNN